MVPEILVSSSFDGTCRVWNVNPGSGTECLFELKATVPPPTTASAHILRGDASSPEEADAAEDFAASRADPVDGGGNANSRPASGSRSESVCPLSPPGFCQRHGYSTYFNVIEAGEVLSLTAVLLRQLCFDFFPTWLSAKYFSYTLMHCRLIVLSRMLALERHSLLGGRLALQA